jgi:cytochrome c-type biogenesis protein CcmE
MDLVIAVAIAGVVTLASIDHTHYYKMVDEVGDLAPWQGKHLQIHGYVAAGSIVEVPGGRTFVLQKAGAQIRVIDRGLKNDCLRDTREVIVSARVVGDRVETDELKCKCASDYRFEPRPGAPVFQ